MMLYQFQLNNYTLFCPVSYVFLKKSTDLWRLPYRRQVFNGILESWKKRSWGFAVHYSRWSSYKVLLDNYVNIAAGTATERITIVVLALFITALISVF